MSRFANSFADTATGTDPYVRALLELLGDRDPMALLPETPAKVAEAVRGLDEATLRKPEAEGKWSVLHVVQHLADSEIVSSVRYRMMIAHDTPAIQGYDQDLFAQRMHYENADLEEALETFRVLRRANVRLLTSLTPEERKRGGMHSERGFEDVEKLMRLLAAHDLVHLNQIARIAGAVAG